MAFEGLNGKADIRVFNKLRGKGHLSEADVKEAMREIRLALLEADVSYKVVKDFIKTGHRSCHRRGHLEASLTPAQMVIKIVNEEMTALMGGEAAQLDYRRQAPPTVIMMVGLQGAGKTTNAAKLANFLRGKKSQQTPAGGLRRVPSRCHQAAGSSGCAAGHSGVPDGADRSGGPSPRQRWNTPRSTATTWCSWTQPAGSMWTRS